MTCPLTPTVIVLAPVLRTATPASAPRCRSISPAWNAARSRPGDDAIAAHSPRPSAACANKAPSTRAPQLPPNVEREQAFATIPIVRNLPAASLNPASMRSHSAPCSRPHCALRPHRTLKIHEIKHDGYRLIVRRDGDRVRLYTRRGYNWNHRFPLIVDAVSRLRVRSAIIDGEAVVCDANGMPS